MSVTEQVIIHIPNNLNNLTTVLPPIALIPIVIRLHPYYTHHCNPNTIHTTKLTTLAYITCNTKGHKYQFVRNSRQMPHTLNRV